jgi:hypothetical protein
VNGTVFALSVLVTVALLGCTIWTGLTARRRAHYPCAVLTVIGLAIAIYQARIYGEAFEIPPDRLRIHLGFAFTALGLLPFAVVTGILLIRRARVRLWHRIFVWSFVAATLTAMGCALWMLDGALARPLA